MHTEAVDNNDPASPDDVALRAGSSPHLTSASSSTRTMMIDVLAALLPVMIMAIVVFRWSAVVKVGLCVLVCLATEMLLNLSIIRKVKFQ